MHDSGTIVQNQNLTKKYKPDVLLILAQSPLAKKRPEIMSEIQGFTLTISRFSQDTALAAIAQSQDSKPKQPRSPDRS